MPRRRRGLPFLVDVNKYIHRFPALKYNGTHITCTICHSNHFMYDAHDCRRHCNNAYHLRNVRNNIPYRQFLCDFIFMLVACNVPFNILDNEIFREFWAKNVPAWKLPGRTHVRNNLPRATGIVKNLVQEELKGNKLWIAVGKTTDAKKNIVVNVVVRTLKPSVSSLPFLLCSKRITIYKTEAIVQVIKDAVKDFDISKMQIEMLVTDGTACMLKAGRILKLYFPNLLHITCLLDAFRFVADTIRQRYSRVDSLIVYNKKIFAESPKCSSAFKEFYPEIPLPVVPILTRWGTWLDAVLYYREHYQSLKEFIWQLNSQESVTIKLSQQLFLDTRVEIDIAEICQKYSVVKESIERLHNSQLSLAESLNIVDNLKVSLQTLSDDEIGCVVSDKFDSILNKNPDLPKIRSILQCICNQVCKNNVQEYFKFANITLLDIERSFSKYTKAYSPSRRCLSESALEAILMLQLYARSVGSVPTAIIK